MMERKQMTAINPLWSGLVQNNPAHRLASTNPVANGSEQDKIWYYLESEGKAKTVAEIAAYFAKTTATVFQSLRSMERRDKVVKHQASLPSGRVVAHYTNCGSPPANEDTKTQRIVDFIKANPGKTARQITEGLGMPGNSMRAIFTNLTVAGKVTLGKVPNPALRKRVSTVHTYTWKD